MTSLYFRITEPPNPTLFDGGWLEIPTSERLHFDRRLWRSEQVSRDPAKCVTLRFDTEEKTWVSANRAAGWVLALQDGTNRYDLSTGMSVELGHGEWRGTLAGAFTFLLTTHRPPGPVRLHDPHPLAEPPASEKTPVVVPAPEDDPGKITLRGSVQQERARSYLARHPLKRHAMAFMWRQHLEHTAGIAEDLTSAAVARAFGDRAPTITGWREELALHVYGERGHQGAIRDLVLLHQVLTRADVEAADEYVRSRGRSGHHGTGPRTTPPQRRDPAPRRWTDARP